MSDRRDRLRHRLAQTRERVGVAARAAGRDAADITVVVVTKTFPASDVELLAGLGVRDVGENRHPEAAEKFDAVQAHLTWHFVGAVQTNKARAVARYADMVHSVDREGLVDALSDGARRAGRVLGCFVQVSLDPATAGAGRSGARPELAPVLADRIAGAEGLRLHGVMAIAPMGADPAGAFAMLSEVAGQVSAAHPTATAVSAGMSGDLEAAIAAGATHVRIGRAILGERPRLG